MGSRGPSPSISETELVETIESVTDQTEPIADTGEIYDALNPAVTPRTVLNRLQTFHNRKQSRIAGQTISDQKGWVWWLTPTETETENY